MDSLLSQLHQAQEENQTLRAELATLHSKLVTYQYIHPANTYKALEPFKDVTRFMSIDSVMLGIDE